MSTFYSSAEHVMAAVAEAIDKIDSDDIDVHTITLVLDGQHGEFNLRIEATDGDMEDRLWTGIAHRGGGITDFAEAKV